MHVYKCQQIKRYINNNILIVLDKKITWLSWTEFVLDIILFKKGIICF